MPPFRSRSEARKGSGTATSGKKAAQQRQAVKDTPVHSALNSDAPGQGPTYQCGAYLRDLNDDEKKKVANLIQQIVHLGSKVQNLEDENAKLKRKASDEPQSPLESATAHNNTELRSKLASAVAMLRSCQQIILQRKDNSSSTAAGVPQLPDIDRFAASCEQLGVAEQCASTGNSGFPSFSQNQNTFASREWRMGQQTHSNTPQSPRTDAAASSFSFPQPPPEEDAHPQAPRDSSRASSTPQPRPKRSRKSQSPLPRSPGRVPEPYQPAQPSNQFFESPAAPYLSPGTYLGSQPGISHATGAPTKPTSPPAPQPTAPYLSQQQIRPYPPPGAQHAQTRDSQHSKSPRSRSPRPATPTSPSRIRVTPNATAQSSSPQQSPKRSTSPRTSALWRSSQPISKPPGTFGTSPRFDYLSAAPTHFLQSTSPRKSREELAPTRNARGSVSPHEHGDRAAQHSTSPLGTQPANTQESQQASGSEARCLEATLSPGDFHAAFATAATTGNEPMMQHVAAQPVDTGGPQQQREVAGAVPSINPTQPEYQNYSVHLQPAAINGHPSSNWHASELPGGGSTTQPASHQNTQQHHPQLDSIYDSTQQQQQSHPGRTFTDSPTGIAVPVPATSAVPESSAEDPSVTTPPAAHPHRSSVEAPFPVSGAQHSMSAASVGGSQPMYPPDAPEATIDSCGSAFPDHSRGSGGAWQGIGAPWSTFAQNGGAPVSQVPPWDAPLSEIGDRVSPSDVGSGGSISQAAREVSFQEAEDVHVHIHFDAPQVHPPPQNPPFATHPPYLQGPSNPPPPNFSPDFMDAHFHSLPQGRRVSQHRPVMHSRRQAPASLAPPPALPLQPLTRLVEFDDSLADLVSQVEASMHVTGSGTMREASAREGSSACAVLAELAPQSQQDPGAYRGDSVTSVPAHCSDALEVYMHEEHVYSTQPPSMPSQTVLLPNRVNSAQSSPSEESGERLQGAKDRDAPRNIPASKLASSRCGEVRTTSRCGKVHTLAANSLRCDTIARAGGSWGENGAGSRSRGQENSLRGSWGASLAERDSIHTSERHKGASIPHNNSSDRPARVGLKERSSVHAHDDYSSRAGMGKSGEYSNQFRSMRQSKLSNSRNARQLGSPSCLDDDDKEMLDVLNCLM